MFYHKTENNQKNSKVKKKENRNALMEVEK